ncbi:hypothetical protein [Clostridium intestinale]|uniref:Uncharacterized protein n=1 Tax=Clostridium intestinale URNW TaxID=1294142 RepID=U2NP38_9CLOT|nr:hypothetical protein [Clostridium intestinale]ERK30596.1 hypothetical protein CINTURNW_2563 [Clostridium intestinale URNW]
MGRVWNNKMFQAVVFVLIAVTIGIIHSKISSLQFVLENAGIIDNSISESLISDIKLTKVLVLIIGGIAVGLYGNFTYSINRNKL